MSAGFTEPATRELYPVGDRPPPGAVPALMHAAVIRPDRYGPPASAMAVETIPVPRPGRGQVLVLVMAAGVNFNNVWASLGKPLDVVKARQRTGATEAFHVGGSEGSGIVWALGEDVRAVRPGDEVILSGCRWDERATDIRFGADPIASTSQQVWGYELNHGSFAQFTVVDEYQCLPKPKALSWEAAACFLLAGATAYRQLCGWPPHTVAPGDPVLIWGGSGGLGSMAIQIVRRLGGLPVAVTSSPERQAHCMRLGACGVIDRREFSHWGAPPDDGDAGAYAAWVDGVRAFGRQVWSAIGERRNPRIVFEHAGSGTLPTSLYLCDSGGMVVICGATSGYRADVDLRYLWMRQKRLQGSHYANLRECREITALVSTGGIDPCLGRVFEFGDIAAAHQLMYENRHPPGNMAVRIGASDAT